jgi:hypothetical protein
MVQRKNGNAPIYYSTNNGETWFFWSQFLPNMILCGTEIAMAIDAYDNMHLVYSKWDTSGTNDGRSHRGQICYRRLTPNGATDWTVGAEQVISSIDYWHCPSIVTHAWDDNGTGDVAVHMAWSYNWSGNNRQIVIYHRILWTAAGVMTHQANQQFIADSTGQGITPTYPTIQYRHNGTGKHPKRVDGVETPDVWIGFTWGTTTRLGYLNYNTTTHTWDSPIHELVDGTYHQWHGPSPLGNVLYEHHRWHQLLYDAAGDTIVFLNQGANSNISVQTFLVYERSPDSPGSWTTWDLGSQTLYSGSACMLPNGDVDIIGVTGWNPPNSVFYYGRMYRQTGGRAFDGLFQLDSSETEPQGTLMPCPRNQVVGFYNDSAGVSLMQFRKPFHFQSANGFWVAVSTYVKDATDTWTDRLHLKL